MRFICLQFVWILMIDLISGEQRFTETPALYQEVSSGDDVQVRCRVQDKRGQCIWQKDRKPVGMHPDKYEWASGRGSDCTLLIRRASLDFDDGYWECQVTSGDFTRQDALTSLPSRLLVRVKPRKPRLEYGGTILTTALTLREGQEVTISCVSRYGNPPALIKWYIGGDEVESLREQTNATEVDSPKTWAAHSLLRVRGQRENHGLPIRCITIHPSSIVPASAETRLDVHYSPEVRLETKPRLLVAALEDSASFMSLKCFADANPSGTIKWFKDSAPITMTSNVVSVMLNRTQPNGTVAGSELRFEPVKRNDAGLYSCKAVNVIGESAPANYRLDVQYGPRIKEDNPSNDTTQKFEETTLLGANLEPFECLDFEANPPAQYRWIHIRGGVTETIENPLENKDGGKRLRLENVMWSDEGEYQCVAFNIINGVRREMPSDARYVLHVTGPPEIQARPSSGGKGFYESLGWAGESEHILKSRFCSRPPPKIVAWQWGSSHIRAGESIHPKYEALPLEHIKENEMVTNCYWAKLVIKDLLKEDARVYTLLVESEKGRDSTNVKLLIRDPTEMRVIAAAAAVGVLFLLLLISVFVYSLLRLKSRRYHKEEEEGSIAADAFYSNTGTTERQKTVSSSQNKGYVSRKTSSEGGLAVTYDYDQITKQVRAMSPEALKVRRAPAVLQPPTIV
ncbi:PREDICTED: hemicentin-2-like [Dufourea novaeangliae]|uniref:Kin of IRRE-like protein 3 n=1 Tax=Dufourea novaeangliae TaxID=178035 RepID=A0A154P7S9_DUFNO|nr:PREDICTED: hemicentin-2-like [Dufourea novaeangliae]KZC07979.1 Kin of IRRE-like protein 3 [Dufourea novaeangliae]